MRKPKRRDDGPRSFGWNRRDSPFPLAWLAFTAPQYSETDGPLHTAATPRPRPTPAARLLLAHLELAWRDATTMNPHTLTARAWFANDDPSPITAFLPTAAALGFDPHAVRAALASHITTTSAAPAATTRTLSATHRLCTAYTWQELSSPTTSQTQAGRGLPHPSKLRAAS